MKFKKSFSFFWFLLVIFFIGYYAASCKSQDNSGLNSADISEFEPEIGNMALKNEDIVDFGENVLIDANLVLGMTNGPDIILSTYRDPLFRDDVIAFFKEITGSIDVAKVVLLNASFFDISPALAFALSYEESRYNPRAFNVNHNETQDRGLFQLNSATFPQLSVDDFYNLEINAYHGLAHLRWCLNTAGTEVAGLAMYNAGSARVSSTGTPKNTLDYISRILNRQRSIEGLFLSEYSKIVYVEIAEEEEKPPFRLSLLSPLGR